MNAQQVFDTVLNGIRAQGKASVDSKGDCMYRGIDGCKCAAGLLIPDEVYDPKMETVSAPQIISLYEGLSHLKEHSRLIDAMQYAHDTHLVDHGMAEWEGEMYDIARRYGLTYSRSIAQPVLQADPPLPFTPVPGAAV